LEASWSTFMLRAAQQALSDFCHSKSLKVDHSSQGIIESSLSKRYHMRLKCAFCDMPSVLDRRRRTAALLDQQTMHSPAGLSQASSVSVTTARSAQLGRSAAQAVGIAGQRAQKYNQSSGALKQVRHAHGSSAQCGFVIIHPFIVSIHNMQCCLYRTRPH